VRTRYLFDASSIVNLIKKGTLKGFEEGATIELALYESLNAVWKEYELLKRMDRDTFIEVIDIVSDLFKVIETLSIRGCEREVIGMALKENVTVYDASYLYIAVKHKLMLVTDDRELKGRASKYIKTLTTNEVAAEYAERGF